MKGLRENIKEMNVTDDVASRLFRRANQNGQVAGQRRRIAGEIGDRRWREPREPGKSWGVHSGTGRVEHDQVGGLIPARQEAFGVGLAEGGIARAALLKVCSQVTSGG